jgi:hypothetical protein
LLDDRAIGVGRAFKRIDRRDVPAIDHNGVDLAGADGAQHILGFRQLFPQRLHFLRLAGKIDHLCDLEHGA